jgi:Zn-dependent M28 family amino/carboxypeptidase
VFHLVDDWSDFLERFGHHFVSSRYALAGEDWQKEVFVNATRLNNSSFQNAQLNLVEKTTSYYTENLIFPLYWNENNTETFVICAHYDHLGQQGAMYYPGADDNASGVAVLLELARLLAKDSLIFSKNIQFVFFSGEEQGLYGSQYFVLESPFFQENTSLCINLDMVGFVQNKDPAIYIVDYAPGDLYNEVFDGIESPYVEFNLIHHEKFLNEFSSDHISFVTQGIPAYMFFTGLHPYYHSPADTPDRLNCDAMNVLTLTLRELLIQLAK